MSKFVLPKATPIVCRSCSRLLLMTTVDVDGSGLYDKDNYEDPFGATKVKWTGTYLLGECLGCTDTVRGAIDACWTKCSLLMTPAGTKKDPKDCWPHAYKKYRGFSKEYDYCTTCDHKINEKGPR